VTRPDPQPQPQPFDIDLDLDLDLDLDPAGLLERLQRAPTPTPPSRFGISAVLIEDLSKRDAHGKHWRHPDRRTYTAVIGRDLHYRRPDGTWDDVDLTLSPVQVGSGARARQVHVTRAPCPVVVDVDGQRLQVTDAQGRGIRYTLPVAPAIVGDEITYQDQGLTWRYRPLPRGLKLEATVPARLGARTFTFAYELLGTAAPLSVGPDGALESDTFRIPPPTATGADGAIYRVGAWRVGGDGTTLALELEYDDTALPDSAFPLELDPTTTFSVSAGGDDVLVWGYGGGYPPAFAGVTQDYTSQVVHRSWDGTFYRIYLGLIRWNTSSLSGTTITSATARLFISGKDSVDSRSVQLEWYNWTPPASSTDYTTTASGTANSGVSIASLTLNAYNDFALSNPNTSINKAGYTGLRVHISGGQPSGYNYINHACFENGTNVPQLVVTYMIPVALSGSASGSTLTGAAQLTNLVQLGAGAAAGSTVTGAAALQTGLTASPAHGSTVTGAAVLSLTLALSGNAAGGTAVPGAALWLSLLLGAGPVAGGTVVAPAAMPVRMAPVAVRAAHHPVLVILATTRPEG
jgi:hypothetical protein